MSEQSTSVLAPEFDLFPIKLKLMDTQEGKGWTQEFSDRVEIEYRRFLLMNKQHPNIAFIPSKLVDDFWHQHILDTRKYQTDCQEYFGYFLHHFPYFGKRGEDDARNLEQCWKQTLAMYESMFQESALNSYAGNCSSSCVGTDNPTTSYAGNCSSSCVGTDNPTTSYAGNCSSSCVGTDNPTTSYDGNCSSGGGDDKYPSDWMRKSILNSDVRPTSYL